MKSIRLGGTRWKTRQKAGGRLVMLMLALVISACSAVNPSITPIPSAPAGLTQTISTSHETPTHLLLSDTPFPTHQPSLQPSATPTITPTPAPYLGMVPRRANFRISKGGIGLIALSPDGKDVVVASSITLCSYRAADYVQNWCSTIGEMSTGGIQNLAFSPDGKTLLSGLTAGGIILWDALKGSQTRVIRAGNLISNPTWSPDGKKFAYSTEDSAIYIWNSLDGNPLQKIQAGTIASSVIAWSPDGKSIAAGGLKGWVDIWDVDTGKTVNSRHPFADNYTVTSLSWTPDSASLLAGSTYISCAENCSPTYDGRIALVDTNSGAVRWSISVGQVIQSLEISPDGTQLLAGVGLGSREVRLYRTSDGGIVHTIHLAPLYVALPAMQNAFWLPDGQGVLTLDGEDNLAVWDVSGAQRSKFHLENYIQLSNPVWSPKGPQLAASAPQGIFIWNSTSGQLDREIELEQPVGSIAWSPDGVTIAAVKDRQVRLWNTHLNKELSPLAITGDYPRDLSWSPDGKLFAVLSLSGYGVQQRLAYIDIWDAQTWKVLWTIKDENWVNDEVEYFAWSPDGKTIAAVGNGITLYDAEKGRLIAGGMYSDMGVNFNTVQFSPDGARLLAASDGLAVIFDINRNTSLVEVKWDRTDQVSSAALSPDGNLLATGGDHITLRDARSGAVLQTLPGFANQPDWLAFSPDGKTLASCAEGEGTIVLWDVPPSLAASNPPPAQEIHTTLASGLRIDEYALTGQPEIEPLAFTTVSGVQPSISFLPSTTIDVHGNESFDVSGHETASVMVGSDTISVIQLGGTATEEPGVKIQVSRNGQVIQTIPAGDVSPLETLQGLWSYGGAHWVLEIAHVTTLRSADNNVSFDAPGQIYQDGALLNDRNNYQAAFDYQTINGKPFYFFQRDGQIHIAYDGTETLLGYTEVPHYGCCSAAARNPRRYVGGIIFFARRGDQWYYVGIGVPASQANLQPASTLPPGSVRPEVIEAIRQFSRRKPAQVSFQNRDPVDPSLPGVAGDTYVADGSEYGLDPNTGQVVKYFAGPGLPAGSRIYTTDELKQMAVQFITAHDPAIQLGALSYEAGNKGTNYFFRWSKAPDGPDYLTYVQVGYTQNGILFQYINIIALLHP